VLADPGADVIKIEAPGGDALRYLPPLVDGTGAVFSFLNAGKRSVALDLKRPQGADVLRGLVARADVLVESFRPGVLDRLRLGPDALRASNPRLIVCSISGFGQTGAKTRDPGHDLGYLARSGVLGASGPAGAPPQVPGVPMADIAGGALPGAIAILAALWDRERTGVGRHLDISLTRGARALARLDLAAAAAGETPTRGGGLLTGGAPCYRVYETRDHRYVALAALEPEFFAAFAQTAGCTHLVGRQHQTGEAARPVVEELERLFRTRTRDEWTSLFHGVDACVEPVLGPDEVVAEAGALRVELGVPGEGEPGPVPALGAHGLAVTRGLGLDPELVRAAIASGALSPASEGEFP
jgi:crotonobetainyl-CoA:carnitine CoA-transferase CaiB-like acyl-CoA transferase